MKPKDAIVLNKIPMVESYPPEDTVPNNGLYQYLLQPGEEHKNQCKKATDRIWSKKTYRPSEITSSCGNWVIYHLNDGPERAIVKEELMFISKDMELLPDYV